MGHLRAQPSKVESKLSDDQNSLCILVHGRFDASLCEDFHDAFSQYDSGIEEYIVDMLDTVYLDSTAIGAFFELRHLSNNIRDQVKILCPPSGLVKQALMNAHVDKVFEVTCLHS